MPDETLTLSGKWLTNLRKQVKDMDFCVLCDNHPSHGHSLDCPLALPGPIPRCSWCGDKMPDGHRYEGPAGTKFCSISCADDAAK